LLRYVLRRLWLLSAGGCLVSARVAIRELQCTQQRMREPLNRTSDLPKEVRPFVRVNLGEPGLDRPLDLLDGGVARALHERSGALVGLRVPAPLRHDSLRTPEGVTQADLRDGQRLKDRREVARQLPVV